MNIKNVASGGDHVPIQAGHVHVGDLPDPPPQAPSFERASSGGDSGPSGHTVTNNVSGNARVGFQAHTVTGPLRVDMGRTAPNRSTDMTAPAATGPQTGPAGSAGGTTSQSLGEAGTLDALKAGHERLRGEDAVEQRDAVADVAVAQKDLAAVGAFFESVRANWPPRVAAPFAPVPEKYQSRLARAEESARAAEDAAADMARATAEVEKQAQAAELARAAGYGGNA